MTMLLNYLKIALRDMRRNKLYAVINLTGLAVGIASFLLVLFFVRYEYGYDRFHPETVYRLGMIEHPKNSSPQKMARTMFPMGPTLQSDFPEVVDFTRIIAMQRVPLQLPGKPSVMSTMCGADASFFNVFNFKLLRGNPHTVLQKPNSIVLSQELATRLFDRLDPIGQILEHRGRDTTFYMVTGVVQDVPAQSHLRFDAVHSMDPALVSEENSNWGNAWMSTYLRLSDSSDPSHLMGGFPGYLQRYVGSEKAAEYELLLQPVRDAHLWSSSFSQDQLNNQKFNGNYLYLLIFVSLLVLALAVINYVNLTTAQTISRAKEIAVRKTNGADRIQIVLQFLVQTLSFTTIALALALALIGLIITPINAFSDRDMPFDLWTDPFWLVTGGAVALGAGLLSGVPIARTLARVQPIGAMKGYLWNSTRSPLGDAMIVVQFTIAIGLSIAAVSAFRQLKFLQEYDIGLNKEEVIVAEVSYVKRHQAVSLMNELRRIPGVIDVTGALRRIGEAIDQNDVVFQRAGEAPILMQATTMFVDYNYIPFFGIELLAGRNISPEFGSDVQGNSYIINERMARKLLGYTDNPKGELSSLIGQNFRYSFQDSLGTIVGIVGDFNFNSLHHEVEPLAITYQYEYYFKELSVRLDKRRLAETLRMIEETWKEVLPNQEIEYRFLDEQMEQLYKADQQVGQMMAVLTFLAIFISCFGLIGLVTFNTERRVKEIGIRKVLGATATGIVMLISNHFVRLVAVAFVIATPISWWFVNNWLQDFAYRINIPWWMFVGAGLVAAIIALVTVAWLAARAAAANPVKSLRSE